LYPVFAPFHFCCILHLGRNTLSRLLLPLPTIPMNILLSQHTTSLSLDLVFLPQNSLKSYSGENQAIGRLSDSQRSCVAIRHPRHFLTSPFLHVTLHNFHLYNSAHDYLGPHFCDAADELLAPAEDAAQMQNTLHATTTPLLTYGQYTQNLEKG
jgi:hypothetical protein